MRNSNSIKSRISFGSFFFFLFIGSAYADIVFDGRFSNMADFSRYSGIEANGFSTAGALAPAGVPGHLQMVSDPSGSDKSVMLATRLFGDLPVHNGLRSEISAPKDPVGSERWYSWGYYLPESWETSPANINNWRIIAQIHDTPDVGENGQRTPPFSLNIQDNELKLMNTFDYDRITSPSDTPTTYQVDFERRNLASWPLETSKWTYLDLHIKWAADDTGFIQFWKDGVLLFHEKNHINTFNDEVGVWFKNGVYGSPMNTEWSSMSMYSTGVKIGDEKETFDTMSMSLVPEPNTYVLMLVGLITITFTAFCRSRSSGRMGKSESFST